MPLYRFGDSLIRTLTGGIGGDENCCCNHCSYTYAAYLDWSGSYDLDLYSKVAGGIPAWYGNFVGTGPLTLDHDAHPGCSPSPSQPENITGTFHSSKTFFAWWHQHSNCPTGDATSQISPTDVHVTITNTGGNDICVNGETVTPGNSKTISPIVDAGFANGNQSGFSGGTEIVVTCGTCA